MFAIFVEEVYARHMDAWALPIALVLLMVSCVVLGLLSADSRPGFSGARSTYKERWFPHSRND
ncbi:MAG TPA: hypothetical protein VGK28_12735 [Candidatus Dormibacteraeota bacterium]|jgi:hypothetical protein